MSSEAMCACIRVKYEPDQLDGRESGRLRESWRCEACGTRFVRELWLLQALTDLAASRAKEAEAIEALARVREERDSRDTEARRLMWITHDHAGIYGDDGEMQCSECAQFGCWDYKNSPWDEVVAAYRGAILQRGSEAMKELNLFSEVDKGE